VIRVLIAEDSAFVAEVLAGVLGSDPEIVVVGRARNGEEAVELARRLRPDVITMDVRMPVLDGIGATEAIMAEVPTPILIVSAAVDEKGTETAFEAIRAGAMDVVEKPRGAFSRDYLAMGAELLRRLKLVSRVRPVRRPARRRKPGAPPMDLPGPSGRGRIVAVAASTGGPAAFSYILGQLPREFPWPLLAVQHIAPGFLDGFVRWLQTQTEMEVRTAEHGEWPRAGTVYFPPDGFHLGVDSGGRIVLDPSAPVDGHRPSATYLFRSVARSYGAQGIGVILTGMGEDGARGLLDLRREGGWTAAQDEATSVVAGMPGAAVDLGAAERVLPLERIPRAILGAGSVPHRRTAGARG
jgi:two-component system chemotaxis response regulator CheB